MTLILKMLYVEKCILIYSHHNTCACYILFIVAILAHVYGSNVYCKYIELS